jgi:hypothetical protein
MARPMPVTSNTRLRADSVKRATTTAAEHRHDDDEDDEDVANESQL